LKVVLADPQGSGLLNKVKHDVMFAVTEKEGKRRRRQVDTVVEGVGNNRMTLNLEMVLGRGRHIRDTERALAVLRGDVDGSAQTKDEDDTAWGPWVDDAERVTDMEAVCMARFMAKHEGLFLGSSSCVNLVAAVKAARKLKQRQKDTDPQPVIVTMLCDSGQRHLTKFWNDDYLIQSGLVAGQDHLKSLPIDYDLQHPSLDFISD
jgi:cysteine synthase A